ncbi:MAG TPA: NAD(P)H-dependent oxidoreductase [Verrucomicrobiae bacterium]|nr:NAD(P)H-dependent oxidoreductase [Verrucomicrobiae bacterium]
MLVVGLGGTLRGGSSCEAALRIALDEAAKLGAQTECFCGPQLDLPMYNPVEPTRPDAALKLVDALRRADGVIVASPGYHGSISGLIKNALDYTEDMVNDARVYFDGIPVGCIATGNGPQGAMTTIDALRAVTHALRGYPTPFAAAICVKPGLFAEGACTDQTIERNLRLVGRQVATFANVERRIVA